MHQGTYVFCNEGIDCPFFQYPSPCLATTHIENSSVEMKIGFHNDCHNHWFEKLHTNWISSYTRIGHLSLQDHSRTHRPKALVETSILMTPEHIFPNQSFIKANILMTSTGTSHFSLFWGSTSFQSYSPAPSQLPEVDGSHNNRPSCPTLPTPTTFLHFASS